MRMTCARTCEHRLTTALCAFAVLVSLSSDGKGSADPMQCLVSPYHYNIKNAAVAQWLSGRAFDSKAVGRGFDPETRRAKDVIKMVPDASLLSAQHTRIGLAFLFSQI